MPSRSEGLVVENGSIWYVHPYAGGPGVGTYDRPFHLVREWRESGINASVIAPAFHHLMYQDAVGIGHRIIAGVPYFFAYAPRYSGNGIGRMVNMIGFAAALVLQCRMAARHCGRPDVVIASSPHPFSVLSAFVLQRLYGCKIVFEIRDLWPLSIIELTNKGPNNFFVRVVGAVERLACHNADHVVSLLENTFPYLETRGLTSDRFAWVPNGVSLAPLQPPVRGGEVQALVSKWKQEGRLVVVYAGTIGLANNLDALLNTARVARDAQEERLRFLIVGEGPRRTHVQNRIVQEDLNNVTVVGRIPKEELQALLPNCDVGYLSLHDSPLFRFGVSPNKLFDYMAASLPVLFAINSPGNPIERYQAGICVAPNDVEATFGALRRLIGLSPGERRSMGAAGRSAVVKHFAYPALAARYLEILRPLLAAKAGSRVTGSEATSQ